MCYLLQYMQLPECGVWVLSLHGWHWPESSGWTYAADMPKTNGVSGTPQDPSSHPTTAALVVDEPS